jgi:hypothetical protein
MGGACSHNKAFGLSPFPTSKRSLHMYIEGLLGQHALCMLGPEDTVIYGNCDDDTVEVARLYTSLREKSICFQTNGQTIIIRDLEDSVF